MSRRQVDVLPCAPGPKRRRHTAARHAEPAHATEKSRPRTKRETTRRNSSTRFAKATSTSTAQYSGDDVKHARVKAKSTGTYDVVFVVSIENSHERRYARVGLNVLVDDCVRGSKVVKIPPGLHSVEIKSSVDLVCGQKMWLDIPVRSNPEWRRNVAVRGLSIRTTSEEDVAEDEDFEIDI